MLCEATFRGPGWSQRGSRDKNNSPLGSSRPGGGPDGRYRGRGEDEAGQSTSWSIFSYFSAEAPFLSEAYFRLAFRVQLGAWHRVCIAGAAGPTVNAAHRSVRKAWAWDGVERDEPYD